MFTNILRFERSIHRDFQSTVSLQFLNDFGVLAVDVQDIRS